MGGNIRLSTRRLSGAWLTHTGAFRGHARMVCGMVPLPFVGEYHGQLHAGVVPLQLFVW